MPAKKKSPPGPRWRFGLDELDELGRDPLALFLALQKEFGDIVFVQGKTSSWYLVTHPNDVEYVLRGNQHNYRKNVVCSRSLAPLLGGGLLTSEGERWSRQRRIAQPAFHRDHIESRLDKIIDATRLMLQRWEVPFKRGEEINLEAELTRLTIEILGQALFDLDLSAKSTLIGNAMTLIADGFSINNLNERACAHEDSMLPGAKAILSTIIDEIIAERQGQTARENDLLTALLTQPAGTSFTHRELRETVATLLFTGYETCSRVLAWTWYLLAGAPEAERYLREELWSVVGDRTPMHHDLPKLLWAKQIIFESMRLFPPVWSFGRRPLCDDRIGGYDIPSGALVILSPYITHRLPSFWEDPERFDPSRFSPERAASRAPFAYFPFGGGLRQCIANQLALIETQIILAMVTSHYRFQLSSRFPVEPEPASTLRSRHGIWVTLRPPEVC